jgi:NADH-quinone oxidoreductase subunit H
MTFEFDLWQLVVTLIFIGVVMGALQGTCAYLILAERKISAWAQDRIGPNRVGPWGILQPLVDGGKFLLKEEVIPDRVDKLFYLLAPAIALGTSTLAFAVVPFGATEPAPLLLDRRTDSMVEKSSTPMTEAERTRFLDENREYRPDPRGPIWPQTETEQAIILAADRAWANDPGKPNTENRQSFEDRVKEYNRTLQFNISPHVDIGIVWIFAISSLAVYAIVLGGWSSNNKYSLLGGLRSSAQLISYEIPMGLSVLGVMLVSGSLNLESMIDYQYQHGWNIFFQPLAALLFTASIFAECNRLPFDLPECEQELVGGYHTEYSALKFGFFFLGEYTHMITTSFLVVIMFFGGWQLLPWVPMPSEGYGALIFKLLVLAGKMALFIIFYMLIRWTLPRFRFDQLMGLTWKVMMPLALINLVGVMVVKLYPLNHWLLLPFSVVVFLLAAYVSLTLPPGRTRGPLTYRGHPIAGARLPDGRAVAP